MSPYCTELVEDFESFAESLIPNHEFIQELKEAAHDIFEDLKQEAYQYEWRVGRTKIGGSVGKGTAIVYQDGDGDWIYPDLDLVAFVNDQEPPFQYVYDCFEEIFEEREDITGIKVGRFSMNFKVETQSYGKIKVDLLAAQNYVVDTSSYYGYDITEVAAMFAKMSLDANAENGIISPEEVKLNSSAFVEKTLKTISNYVADPFIAANVRLAKRWMRGIDLHDFGYVPARSCLSELIAIKSQLTRRSKRTGSERCLVSGFRRTMECMSKLSKQDIDLDNSQPQLKSHIKPMVRDPGNKANNLAGGISQEVIAVLEQQAKRTLKLLKKVRNQDGYYEYDNVIEEIFCTHK